MKRALVDNARVRNLRTRDDLDPAVVHEIEARDHGRAVKPVLRPIADYLDQVALGADDDQVELHSVEDWTIAYVMPNQHRRAKRNLFEKGYECYYPVGKRVHMPPLRKIAPSKRHLRHMMAREIEFYPYGGYVFIRRVAGSFDVMSCYTLSGVAGVCCMGGAPARMRDWQIELIRLDEQRGRFESYMVDSRVHGVLVAGAVATGEERPVDRKGWLDDSLGTVLFRDQLGRVTKLISSAGESQMR